MDIVSSFVVNVHVDASSFSQSYRTVIIIQAAEFYQGAEMSTIKTSWADDVEELEQPREGEDYVDENGVRTTIEYSINDEGKKIKASLHSSA
jgi:hypothetical protein